MYDLIIVGAGPAGLTCGIYAGRAGLNTLLVEKMFPGGQASTTYQVDNYPGFAEGVEGPALMAQFEAQAKRFGAQIKSGMIQNINLREKTVTVGGEIFSSKAMVLAMGAEPRKLGVDKEDALRGSGVSYCATCDGNFFKGQKVAVVGGGDTALEDAVFLSQVCETVYLIHRRDAFRGTKVLQESVRDNDKIQVLYDTVVESLIDVDFRLNSLNLKNVKTGETTQLPVSGLFIAVGTLPETEQVAGQLQLENGYIPVDAEMKTEIPGVFAAGDVTTTNLRQIVTAAADGARAAFFAERYLALETK